MKDIFCWRKYGRKAEYVDMEAQVLVRHTSDVKSLTNSSEP